MPQYKDKAEIPVTIKGNYGPFEVIWDGQTTICKGCGEEIGFAKTRNGKFMPIDIPATDAEATDSHFNTCTQADKFRKDKK